MRDSASMDAAAIDPERVKLETRIAELTQPLSYPHLNVFDAECFEVVDEYVR
jgi:hypothetical protein